MHPHASPDPDILVELTTAANEFEAEVIAQALEAEGIPARAFTTAGRVLRWDLASTAPMKVFVRRADLGRAAEALAEIRADSAVYDWSEAAASDDLSPTETRREDHHVAVRRAARTRRRRRLAFVLLFIGAAMAYPALLLPALLIAGLVELRAWSRDLAVGRQQPPASR